MPRALKELPWYFVPDPTDSKRIQCTLCLNKGIRRGSKSSHEESDLHMERMAAHEKSKTAPTNGGNIAAAGSMNLSGVTLDTPVTAPPVARTGRLSLVRRLLAESDSSDDDMQVVPQDELLWRNVLTEETMEEYIDKDGNNVLFTAGQLTQGERDLEKREKEINFQLSHLELMDEKTILGKPEEHEEFWKKVDNVDESLDDEDILANKVGDGGVLETATQDTEGDWFPHGSKVAFLLDFYDHSFRHQLSNEQLEGMLLLLRECGVPGVPTVNGFRQMQKRLDNNLDLHAKQHTSSMGNHFYMNHPAKLLALDWANPYVRPHIHIYPEVDPDTPVCEPWQAGKWVKDVSIDRLSPMWANFDTNPYQHFYIKELATLDDGSLVIPMRWVTVKGVVHAECYRVHHDKQNDCFTLADPSLERINALRLFANYFETVKEGTQPRFLDGSPSWTAQMPHPIRKKAKGRPVFRTRTTVWSDDVSGNVSKQYNAHTNIYVQTANVPHKLLAQDFFVRFCSTSQYASSTEQMAALEEDFNNDHWTEAYDCQLQCDVLIQIIPHILPADNPQQAETSSHLGVHANLYCRRDWAGGSKEEKESDKGYHALFSPGVPRDPSETVATIQKQLHLACLGNKSTVTNLTSQTGIKDKIATHWIDLLIAKANNEQVVRFEQDPVIRQAKEDALRKGTQAKGKKYSRRRQEIIQEVQKELYEWLLTQPTSSYNALSEDSDMRHRLRPGDHYNPVFGFDGLNPHTDTPVEMLHTIYLGLDKYLWHDTTKKWDNSICALFAARLQSANLAGLNLSHPPAATYMMQYKNSLIGRHFKLLQQLAFFQLYDFGKEGDEEERNGNEKAGKKQGDEKKDGKKEESKNCKPELLALWKAMGELGALLGYIEIDNMDQYLKDLQIALDNVLDAWADYDGRRIINKVKIHISTHIPNDIRAFGPLLLFATEIFESFNAVFRKCSILSNHQAPSRDIAMTFAGFERFKHQASGGWWKDSETNRHVRIGPQSRRFFAENANFRKRLGWTQETSKPKHFVKRCIPGCRETGLWIDHHPSHPPPFATDSNQLWDLCQSFSSRSMDNCRQGSWVFFKKSEDPVVGRIKSIIVPSAPLLDENQLVVAVEYYKTLDTRHPFYGMPMLLQTDEVHLMPMSNILFSVNCQHDCATGRCKVADSVNIFSKQERLDTANPQQVVQHSDDNHYILNLHALHNAHLIRQALHRDLWVPVPLKKDRLHFHQSISAKLQVIGPAMREQTRLKTQQTRERNNQLMNALNSPQE